MRVGGTSPVRRRRVIVRSIVRVIDPIRVRFRFRLRVVVRRPEHVDTCEGSRWF